MVTQQRALTFVNTMFGWPMAAVGGPAGRGSGLSAIGASGCVSATRPINSVNDSRWASNSGSPSPKNRERRPAEGRQRPRRDQLPAQPRHARPRRTSIFLPRHRCAWSRPASQGAASRRASIKVGAWYDTERFRRPTLRPAERLSLLSRSDAADGTPLQPSRPTMAVYAVADQMVWRDRQGPRIIPVSVFGRAIEHAAGRPQPDRFQSERGGVVLQDSHHLRVSTTPVGLGHGLYPRFEPAVASGLEPRSPTPLRCLKHDPNA